MERQELDYYDGDEAVQRKEEHKKYKKTYKKYASVLFTVKKEHSNKVEGKREYDKEPEKFNSTLNDKIKDLNAEISTQIKGKDYNQIKYIDTSFNNFHDLTLGHDGLLDISYLLFNEYPILGKILQDKFDFILIDEYQDTNKNIIDILLNKFSDQNKRLIGLFGDSMQAIYGNGVGDVDNHVRNNILIRIDKEDNYRCSEQVTNFINKLRNDGLVQKIAFKNKEDRTKESIAERQGSVILYYSLYEEKRFFCALFRSEADTRNNRPPCAVKGNPA